MPAISPDTATRVFLRPIASPFALGFLGLAGASVTVAGLELGWVPAGERQGHEPRARHVPLSRGRGREVIAGDLVDQIAKLGNEAGIREQL